jgi:hypothetical protein
MEAVDIVLVFQDTWRVTVAAAQKRQSHIFLLDDALYNPMVPVNSMRAER